MNVSQGCQGSGTQPIAQPLRSPWFSSLALLLILLLALNPGLSIERVTRLPDGHVRPTPVWGVKPLLGYFVFTTSLGERLPGEAGLNDTQFYALEEIAQQETDRLQLLELESLPIIQNPQLTLEQKRQHIAELNYNARVKEVVRSSQKELLFALGPYPYLRLARWIERQWAVERKLHGSPLKSSNLRTYRIFATRYDSNGAYTVALPDKCLKFANGGSHICDGDGYTVGLGYTVFISYKGSTAATVGESGPWNVDDNFWATLRDPTPRRMFADLALGMPEAQAAYFNGYNGGVDQFGRTVVAPFAIDLAREVSIDIGLKPGNNDWIDVSFMWTEGWDGSSTAKPPKPGETAAPQPTQETVIPIKIASPNPDGSLVHEVQEGQTLWNIAAAYQVKLSEILRLNGLTDGSLIYPGQKLLIKTSSLTPTLASTETATSSLVTDTATATSRATITPILKPATEIAQVVVTNHPPDAVRTEQDTSVLQESSPVPRAIDPMLAAIFAFAVVGVAIFLLGQWLSRRT